MEHAQAQSNNRAEFFYRLKFVVNIFCPRFVNGNQAFVCSNGVLVAYRHLMDETRDKALNRKSFLRLFCFCTDYFYMG